MGCINVGVVFYNSGKAKFTINKVIKGFCNLVISRSLCTKAIIAPGGVNKQRVRGNARKLDAKPEATTPPVHALPLTVNTTLLTFGPRRRQTRRVKLQSEIEMAYDLRARKVTNYKEVVSVEQCKAAVKKGQGKRSFTSWK